MHSNFRKALVAAAMIGMAPSAFADVITDWNEKTVAFVTPRMVPAAGQRVVAIVQVAMFDAVQFNRTPLPALFDPASGRCDGVEGGRCRRRCRHRPGWPLSAGSGPEGRHGGLPRHDPRR